MYKPSNKKKFWTRNPYFSNTGTYIHNPLAAIVMADNESVFAVGCVENPFVFYLKMELWNVMVDTDR